ncbi:MAG: M56 family peptidase [Parabacteroides sp.]|nr:M56 family peptidase [Parabacteroides sp.]
MGTFLVFIMKSTCCLAVFYLFYRLFLSRDTFHRFNRMALLSVIAFSVTIPFVRFTTEEPTLVQRAMFDMEQLLQMADAPVGETEAGDFPLGLMILFAAYIGGCLFFTGRFLYSVWQIVRLIHAGEVTVLEDGTRLVVTERTNPPFSWMKYVVISRIDMEESGAEILAHERAHIKACHSLDMWLAGCCTVLHWFNPAAWLLKQELQNVHEYEADEQVIAHGVDARHYQLLLIKKAVGSQRFTSMANSFNHSKLKNRITMMLKQKSNPWARLKFLYVLPLAAVTVVAFARPEISRQLEMIADVELPESLVYQQDKKSADQKLTEQKPADKKPARKDKPKIEMAVNLEPHGEVVVVGHGSTKLQDGKVFDIVRRDTLFPRTLDFQSNKRHSSIPSVRYSKPDPLVIIDGVECAGDLSQVNTNEIKSITVMKDENAIKAYGQKANGGVILITTKKVSSQIK